MVVAVAAKGLRAATVEAGEGTWQGGGSNGRRGGNVAARGGWPMA